MADDNCRKCGADVFTCVGYLKRVNPKGEDGIWECHPSCNAQMADDERVVAAITGALEDGNA